MITSFSGEYRFLSNFWVAEIVIDSKTYKSTEHAYQAMKARNVEDSLKIQNASTPGQAKRLGREIDIIHLWDGIKLNIMRKIVEAKFEQHPDLMKKLLETKGQELIEGNTWGDTFWGECPLGNGKNELGKILMAIRDDITRI